MTPDSLDALRDIHLPSTPAWWMTPEAWMVAAVLIALCAWALHWRLRHRVLRRALHDLTALEAAHARDSDDARLARGVAHLLRRHAIACFPEAGVEGMTGHDWLAFLDAQGGGNAFTSGPGAVLESLPYRASGRTDVRALVEMARRWLRENPR